MLFLRCGQPSTTKLVALKADFVILTFILRLTVQQLQATVKDDTAFANFNACARPVELEITKAAEFLYAVLREDPELRQNLEV